MDDWFVILYHALPVCKIWKSNKIMTKQGSNDHLPSSARTCIFNSD